MLSLTATDILQDTINSMRDLRNEASQAGLDPEAMAQIDEVVGFYSEALPSFEDHLLMVEFCGRAIADLTHEIAAAKFGYQSEKADAVFDNEDRKLSALVRYLNSFRRH